MSPRPAIFTFALTLTLALVAAAASGCDSDVRFTPSGKPERITAISSGGGVRLYWEVVPGASGYRVKDAETGAVLKETDLPEAEIDSTEQAISLFITARRGNSESDPSPTIVSMRQPDRLSPMPVWVASNDGLAFGSAITRAGDVDDDGFEDVLIGAPLTSGGGAVFLFRGTGAGLEQRYASVTTSGALGEAFGSSLAFSETHRRGQPAWIVGAPGGLGRVYVYGDVATSPWGSLSLTTHNAPAGFESTGFGSTVVSAGNLNGVIPRCDELAIAAPFGATGGRVFIFPGDPLDADALSMIEVGLEDAAIDDALGVAMAGGGNLETDPADDLLIGAPGYSFESGGVAIVHGRLDLFSAAVLPVPIEGDLIGAAPGERLGSSIAFAGDPDEDDRSEFVVGGPLHDCVVDDSILDESGRIVIVDPLDFAPSTVCYAAGQRLGASLSLTEVSVFSDDQQEILDGSIDASGQGSFRLSVVTYNLDPDKPRPTPTPAVLAASPGAIGDAPPGIFGEGYGEVVASADVNGDGRGDILVGIPSYGAHGKALLYVTVPYYGPEVHAGPLIDTAPGEEVRLAAAFVSDSVGAEYRCEIDWGDGAQTEISSGCTAAILRDARHEYLTAPPPGEHVDYPVSVRVWATDGRSGMGLTRVRVR